MGPSSPLVASCTSRSREYRNFSRSTFMVSFSRCPATPQAPLRKVTTPKVAGCTPLLLVARCTTCEAGQSPWYLASTYDAQRYLPTRVPGATRRGVLPVEVL
jgi:hypothetical protein